MTDMAKPKTDLSNFGASDEHKVIKYGPLGDNGEPSKSKKVTFRDPGYGRALKIRALRNIGNNEQDIGELAAQINQYVIVNPRYSFDDLDKAVSDEDKTKEVELEGKHGKKPHVLIKFPGYRAAINYSNDIRGVNGADETLDTLQSLSKEVFRQVDDPKKPIDMKFWTDNGGGIEALAKALVYFNEVMDRDGYSAVFGEAYTFLGECL